MHGYISVKDSVLLSTIARCFRVSTVYGARYSILSTSYIDFLISYMY